MKGTELLHLQLSHDEPCLVKNASYKWTCLSLLEKVSIPFFVLQAGQCCGAIVLNFGASSFGAFCCCFHIFAPREIQVAIIKLYNESVIITFNSWKRLEIWKRLKYLENNQTSLVQIRHRRTGDEIAQTRMRLLKTCSAPLAPAPHASGSWKHEQLKQLKIHAQIQYWRVRGLRKKAL